MVKSAGADVWVPLVATAVQKRVELVALVHGGSVKVVEKVPSALTATAGSAVWSTVISICRLAGFGSLTVPETV